jgi:hypothetical protein
MVVFFSLLLRDIFKKRTNDGISGSITTTTTTTRLPKQNGGQLQQHDNTQDKYRQDGRNMVKGYHYIDALHYSCSMILVTATQKVGRGGSFNITKH